VKNGSYYPEEVCLFTGREADDVECVLEGQSQKNMSKAR
jgi:hypothetical protein